MNPPARKLRALALAAVSLLLGSCRGSEEEQRPVAPSRLGPGYTVRLSGQDQEALGLQIAVAEEGDLPDAVLRFGRVRARVGEDALVVSPISGHIPGPPAVALGARIAAGAALLRVVPVLGAGERVSLNVQGAELEGQIEAAVRELATLEVEAARSRELAKEQIVSQQKLQQAETAVATTRARLEALRRARGLQVSGEAGAITLRAPVAGTVVALDAPIGAVVHAGDVLARILKPGPRWIDVAVPPEEQAGRAYEVSSDGEWIPAHLVARGAVVGEDGARHDRLEISAEQAVAVLPGATVSVRVARGSSRGVVIPEEALAPGVGSDLVYVENAKGIFAPRAVRVAARFGGRARIAQGLAVGEKVVARGAMALQGERLRAVLGSEE